MSNPAKKKRTERTHKPSHHTTDEVAMGIIWREDKYEKPLATRIIFLGKENLVKSRGYKAFGDGIFRP